MNNAELELKNALMQVPGLTDSVSNRILEAIDGALPGTGDLLSSNNLSDVSNLATARTNLGAQATLVSGTSIKTINGASILGAGDLTITGDLLAANALSELTGVAGTARTNINAQGLDDRLTALATTSAAADKLFYFTSNTTGAVTTLTSAGRTLIGGADAAAQRTTLGAQATLVSASNIKTVNGSSLLGAGDLTVSGGGSSGYLGTAASDAAMIALSTATAGSICLRLPDAGGTTGGTRYELTVAPYSTLGNWQPIQGTLSGTTAVDVALVAGSGPWTFRVKVGTGDVVTVSVDGAAVAILPESANLHAVVVSDIPGAVSPATVRIQKTTSGGGTSYFSRDS